MPETHGSGFLPMHVLDIELALGIHDVSAPIGAHRARALVRAHGAPVGHIDLTINDGMCRADSVRAALRTQIGSGILPFVRRPQDAAAALRFESDLPRLLREPAPHTGAWPALTVAVCTRDRPADLEQCLDHLVAVEYPGLDIVVIDNAPTDDRTRAVCTRYPGVRYTVEPRPGLNWARNRAILEATGEILAFTDDDVRVEPAWARELVRPFLDDAAVMAVAGFATAAELETPAQLLFEEYGGASGGFRRIRMQGGPAWGVKGFWHYALFAPHGSGANMAFRRSVFDSIGVFDPALDTGTATLAGGDTEMLFRVLAEGHAMVYEPRAVVRHRHRRHMHELDRQIAGWGTGFAAFLLRGIGAYPRAWWVLGLATVRHLMLLAARIVRPGGVPRRLARIEFAAALAAPVRYWRARRRARAIERESGRQTPRVMARP